MSRPPAPPRRPAAARPAAAPLAAVVALVALAGCRAGQVIEQCPGVPAAVLALTATRTAASCQGDTAPADGQKACDALALPVPVSCLLDRPVPPCCFDSLFRPEVNLEATIAFGGLDDSAAFCLPVPGAVPYTGTRTTTASGDAISVALDTAGAVLASCSSTCAVTVHHAVTGLLQRDPVSGAVTGFTGESTETASATPAATCTPCTAPCAATWSLAPTPTP